MSERVQSEGSDEWTADAARNLAGRLTEKIERHIKEFYEGNRSLDAVMAVELFLWDRAQTRWVREQLFEDKIRQVVYEATIVRVVEAERDPTRVEHVRAKQILFEHATDGLIRDMGKAAFSAFLHELADSELLQHEEFEGHLVSSIMNQHIPYERLREEERRRAIEQDLADL